MGYLTAAVVLVGLLCLFTLLLLLGVIRKLRDHARLLDLLAAAPPEAMHPAGTPVGEFTTATLDGEIVSRGRLREATLVGFFSPSCGPCRENLPEFAQRARRMPGGPDQVLAVVVAHPAQAGTDFADRLTTVAHVAVEPPDGPVAGAFGVRRFPAYGLVDADGVLVASGTSLAGIPLAVAG